MKTLNTQHTTEQNKEKNQSKTNSNLRSVRRNAAEEKFPNVAYENKNVKRITRPQKIKNMLTKY